MARPPRGEAAGEEGEQTRAEAQRQKARDRTGSRYIPGIGPDPRGAGRGAPGHWVNKADGSWEWVKGRGKGKGKK